MKTPNENLQEVLRKTMVRLMHQSMRNFWRYAKEQGLSITQMIALRQIYYHGEQNGCSVSDISENLGVSNPATSQSLDKLVQMGLISRQENPHDRRSKQILLTEHGKRVLVESMHPQRIWLKELLERLTPEETEQISNALSLLEEKLAEIE
ncbi:MAG TPA: MarR family transcriptional regulator [Anaerolineae bacterium]|nr:MarR family transcriptional regulator [Anaerolineae bacterium]